ncbi:MAG: adenine deaminase [Candidatus Tectomicrobia bacterium]|nr:adenine deaminase [Candidatus Tectomicrobia bacterium]
MVRRQKRIEMGYREDKADLLLKGVNLVNIFSGEIYPTNVAVGDGTIVGIGREYREGRVIYDLSGKYLLPGFINGHVHIESSLLIPSRYAEAVVPHGTTTVIADPHEIGNVWGIEGIRYLKNDSENLPLDLFFMAPSCVPATTLETSGSAIGVKEIERLLKWDRVLGLAEVMNYPGVILRNDEVLAKLSVTEQQGKLIDGHAPGVTGVSLNAYLDGGIESDHECITASEAKEKLRLGMWVMIREGSTAKNLADLLPVADEVGHHRCLFVTDDLDPCDILEEGELDRILRKAVGLGFDPISATRMATLNPATYFGLRKRGAIAPGYLADMVIVNNLREFSVEMVFKRGELVAERGRFLKEVRPFPLSRAMPGMRIPSLSPRSFALPEHLGNIRVIGMIPDQIVTDSLELSGKIENGYLVSDPESDILKLAVIERHKGTGQIGLGFVKGFGLKKGAVASSVAHDSHNIIVAGVSDDDMICAVQKVKEIGGGYVFSQEGKILSALPLPIAGLMTDKPITQVVFELRELNRLLHHAGVKPVHPFIALSFLALPVIPKLKLTDKGLVDVCQFTLLPLMTGAHRSESS